MLPPPPTSAELVMAFSEELKLEVKKKAMFQCCRCHEIGIEIHHIISHKEHGPDTIENAAPLCPNCHTWFGDNPIKRTEITQMRDHWFETVKQMYGPKVEPITPLLEKISDTVEKVKNKTDITNNEMLVLKNTLKEVTNKSIDNMALGTIDVTTSNLVLASTASLSGMRTDDSYGRYWCKNCDNRYQSYYSNVCPNCHSVMDNM